MYKINSMLLLLLFFSLFFTSCSNSNKTGIQGEWSEFHYTVGEEDQIRNTQTKVIVEDSFYQVFNGRVQLIVEWKAINTGKEPASFDWANKALMDDEERLFAPYDGEYADAIQPLDETHTLRILYEIPQAVNTESLYWGLYHGDPEEGLKYKIKLTPERRN